MQMYICMGKGGVGKSTLAVETAMVLSQYGRSVVIGIDQQHNHADIVKLNGYDVDCLSILPYINEWVEFTLENIGLGAYKDISKYLIPDFIAMLHLAETYRQIKGKYDYIVVDFPPNHAGLNMVRYPDFLHNTAFKVITMKQRIKRMITGNSEVLDRIEYLVDILKDLRDVIREAKFVIIGIPSDLGFIESVKAYELLLELKFKPFRIVCNMVYPIPEADCEICMQLYNKHNEMLAKFNEFFDRAGFNVVQIPYYVDPEDMRCEIDNEILGEDFEMA